MIMIVVVKVVDGFVVAPSEDQRQAATPFPHLTVSSAVVVVVMSMMSGLLVVLASTQDESARSTILCALAVGRSCRPALADDE